jgi:hypothetical protein
MRLAGARQQPASSPPAARDWRVTQLPASSGWPVLCLILRRRPPPECHLILTAVLVATEPRLVVPADLALGDAARCCRVPLATGVTNCLATVDNLLGREPVRGVR